MQSACSHRLTVRTDEHLKPHPPPPCADTELLYTFRHVCCISTSGSRKFGDS